MRYDLKCPLLESTFYIECRLADKPETLGDLLNGISSGSIRFQPDYEDKMSRLYKKIIKDDLLDMAHPLLTDFATQKPIRHNINWPRTEDTK